MAVINISNTKPLFGKIKINGSKNSSLPIISASILSESPIVLHNIPKITDVLSMVDLLSSIGVKSTFIDEEDESHSLYLDPTNINSLVACDEVVRRIRSSCLILGPLLARFKKAKIGFPGGCAIGDRPIDMHLDSLAKMGACIKIQEKCIESSVEGSLKGVNINFDIVSVGATENVMMAATLANGVTTISNAAIDPEVVDLANFLVSMGARIDGIGTKRLIIEGVKSLSGNKYSIMPDRLEAGTYILSAAITGGKIDLLGIELFHIGCMIEQLHSIGVEIKQIDNGLCVFRKDDYIRPTTIETLPYPGFSTDMQSQFAAVLSVADGVSTIKENIFSNRFMYVSELNKMGANIKNISNNRIIINGVKEFYGTSVKPNDLRSAAGLLIAGLRAKGNTQVTDAFHLLRGYESIDKKLSTCGANVSIDLLVK